MPERHGDKIVETTTEARAGDTGTGLRWMLYLGIAAVIILFALAWLYISSQQS
jgi:hypothetical protein